MVGGTEKNIAEKEMGNKVDLGSFTMEVTVELRPGGRLCASETKAPLLPVKKFRKDALIFLWEP